MGHKVHPKIHRTPVTYKWDSRWFSKDGYAKNIKQDLAIREYIKEKCKSAHVDAISVEQSPKRVEVTILASKPGFIIGRNGQGLDEIRQHIEKKILKMQTKVKLNVKEVYSPALSAEVVAQTIAGDIERRIPFRRVMKQTIEKVMAAGAKGIKIRMAGRLNGAEIARAEVLSAGKVPLITLRSDVDYTAVRANTIYGVIGVKVWIYKGELFSPKDKFDQPASAPRKGGQGPRKGGPRRPRNSSAPKAEKK